MSVEENRFEKEQALREFKDRGYGEELIVNDSIITLSEVDMKDKKVKELDKKAKVVDDIIEVLMKAGLLAVKDKWRVNFGQYSSQH